MKMKKKWMRMLTATAFAVILALPLNASAVRNNAPLDLEAACSLTANVVGTETEAVEEAELSQLASDSIVIDLYKVADIEQADGYDDYKYGSFGIYEAQGGTNLQDAANELLQAESGTAESWDRLAQDVAGVVRESVEAAPAASGNADAAIALEGPGLYLMIVRQAGLEDYFKDVVTEDGDSRMVTRVLSQHYEYNFIPVLVSLPEHMATEDGGYEWAYNVAVNPKHSTSYRYGSLRIVKDLTSYESGNPATFVFQVECSYADDADRVGSEFYYSNVVALNFTGPGSQEILLENVFPMGAAVSVEEVYSGSAYTPAAGTASLQNAVIQVDDTGNDTVTVPFTNEYNNSGNGGGSVVNSFDSNPEGGWTWTQSGFDSRGENVVTHGAENAEN